MKTRSGDSKAAPGRRVLLAGISLLLLSATARANVVEFTALLSGPAESPPNASPGTGFADVFYDDVAHTLAVHIDFADLLSPTAASHIHAPTPTPFSGTAGVATTVPTFAGFPLNVTSGTYDNTLDLTLASSFNPGFVAANGGTTAAAEAVLVAAIFAGESYVNIHTQEFPGGEIRGFLTRVPDSASTVVLMALALAGLGGVGAWRAPRCFRGIG